MSRILCGSEVSPYREKKKKKIAKMLRLQTGGWNKRDLTFVIQSKHVAVSATVISNVPFFFFSQGPHETTLCSLFPGR